MTDKEIIEGLQRGGKRYEEVADYLFQTHLGFIPKIKLKLSLNEQDIQDAYADTLVKLVRQIREGRFRGESKVSSYFYSIFYNSAVDYLRKRTSKKNIETIELHDYSAVEKDLMDRLEIKEEAHRMRILFKSLGKSCQQILLDWAYYGYSMKEISQRANLKNEESARSMKYKCMQKLKVILASQKD